MVFLQKDDSVVALKGLIAYANTHSQIPSMYVRRINKAAHTSECKLISKVSYFQEFI